jgi:flavin-binding protein dodecin
MSLHVAYHFHAIFSDTPSRRRLRRRLQPVPMPPRRPIRTLMSNHVYKLIELTGSSPVSSDEAIRNAVARAGQTVRNMRWFEVLETRGHIDAGQVAHWQVTIKIGFTLDDEA